MKYSYTRFGLVAILMAAVLFFSGCAQMSADKARAGLPGPEDDRAAHLAVDLDRINQSLISFSGVGRLTVKRSGQIQLRERVAWVGSAPDKLSVVIFISGFPTVRFATDGKWFYIIEPHDNEPVFRQVRASDSSLAQVIGIEISFEEIVTLLRGRIPLNDFRTALVTPGSTESLEVLTLKKWWGTYQKIMIEAGSSVPHSMERFDRSGKKRYQAIFENVKSIEGHRVPMHLRIFADEGAEFSLIMTRYLPNVDVSEDMFILKPVK